MAQTIHTHPLNDLIEHVTDGGDCPCGPDVDRVEAEDGSIGYSVVHHSLDGREHREPNHDREACPGCRAADAGVNS